jgi:hypothetical protein
VSQHVEHVHEVVLRRHRAPPIGLLLLLEHAAHIDGVVDPELQHAAMLLDTALHRDRHHVETEQPIELVGRELILEAV